jgi:glycosyltransferase involved in cell wall biosynthesis
LLVKAWQLYRSQGGNGASLLLAAPRLTRPTVESRAVSERVRLACSADDSIRLIEGSEDLPSLYRAADVFCLPSGQEGLSNACLEALSSGLPLILCETSGSKDLVPGDTTGLIVEPQEAALAVAFHKLEDDEVRLCLASAARQVAESTFAADVVYGRYLSLLTRIWES